MNFEQIAMITKNSLEYCALCRVQVASAPPTKFIPDFRAKASAGVSHFNNFLGREFNKNSITPTSFFVILERSVFCGESLFLRKLVLGIPAQASGKNLTRPLMPSAPQTSCVRATSPHHRKLGAGYVALPQMTGRRFGKPFILSPPTLALRFRQNNGPTPTGDYQPSRSLSMAGSVGKKRLINPLICSTNPFSQLWYG